jgi:hypothetical protein
MLRKNSMLCVASRHVCVLTTFGLRVLTSCQKKKSNDGSAVSHGGETYIKSLKGKSNDSP